MPQLRALVIWSLLFCFPAIAASDKAEIAGAIMRSHGKVQLNGTNPPTTMALFAGDAVQTEADMVGSVRNAWEKGDRDGDCQRRDQCS